MQLQVIQKKIYEIRGHKVMLDFDLAELIRSQIVTTSNQSKRNTAVTPFVFTEHGVTMLASVLRSKKAIKMNIAIVEAFVALKEFALNYRELAEKIAKLERKNRRQFRDVYEALNYLLDKDKQEAEQKQRKRIGFRH